MLDYMIGSQRKLRDEVWEKVRTRLDLPLDAKVPATPAELEQLMEAKMAEEASRHAAGVHFQDLMGILRTLNGLEAEEQRAHYTP